MKMVRADVVFEQFSCSRMLLAKGDEEPMKVTMDLNLYSQYFFLVLLTLP